MKFYQMTKNDFNKVQEIKQYNPDEISSIILIPTKKPAEDDGNFNLFQIALVNQSDDVVGKSTYRSIISFTPSEINIHIKFDVISCGYVRVFACDFFKRWQCW